MRWLDITLPEPGNCQEFDAQLAAAHELAGSVVEIQELHGLDSFRILDLMREVGQILFQAVATADQEAFSPARVEQNRSLPKLGQPDHDALTGYHIVAGTEHLSLPWTWLHNGLEFLFEKHPICASLTGAELLPGQEDRPWMQRMTRSRFLVGEDGSSSLRDTVAQLRPDGGLMPELLFVPGHSDRQTRRMIYREAEAITAALEDGFMGTTLTSVKVPASPVTPNDLRLQGPGYQIIHFAGPTGQPARSDDAQGEYWMTRLIEETTAWQDRELEDLLGMEGEVLGVDPITSLLDQATDNYERQGPPPAPVTVGHDAAANSSGAGSLQGPPTQHDQAPRSWLLDDGPVQPESMGLSGNLPPLIFSNSYRALPELGQRFTQQGASTFIGPVVPLLSRPARLFAGYCYHAMGEGWCAGAAVWKAAMSCRQELGADHPAWLSYGIQGYGSLALQYL